MIATKEILLNRDLSQQIGAFYRVENDFQVIKQFDSEPAQRAYLKENIFKFVLEFAAGVKKTTINYHLDRQGNIYYPGMPVPVWEMFNCSAELAGPDSREQAELIGWQAIEQALKDPTVKNVIQLSPPCASSPEHGDYGFLFWFERQGNQITNHIIRYAEDKQTGLDQSRQIYEGFGVNTPRSIDDQAFLRNPLLLNDNRDMIISLLGGLGLETSDLTAEEFEKTLLSDPAVLYHLTMYQQAIIKGEYDSVLSLQKHLEYIYQQASELAGLMGLLDRVPYALPLIYGGGSCPVTQFGLPTYGYAGWLTSPIYKGEKRKTKCPGCGHEWLLGAKHIKNGIKCNCGSKVEGGSGSRCIVEASKSATNYEQHWLTEAETCD